MAWIVLGLALLVALALALVLQGILPLRWLCPLGEALYWASCLECVPVVGAVATRIGRIARWELARLGAQSVYEAKRLAPLEVDAAGVGGSQLDPLRLESALEACWRGISHLEGPWHDQHLHLEIAVLLEQLQLHAAYLCFAAGQRQRGREHYCYAKEIAIDSDNGQAAAGARDEGTGDARTMLRNCGPLVALALASCSGICNVLAGDGHSSNMDYVIDEFLDRYPPRHCGPRNLGRCRGLSSLGGLGRRGCVATPRIG